MPPFNYVTLVAEGGVPMRLANQDGTPFPTTGYGPLVFGNNPRLTNPIIEGLVWSGPLGLPAGSAEEPSLYLGAQENRDGFYAPTVHAISVVLDEAVVATFEEDGFVVPGNITYGGTLIGAYHSPLTTEGDLYYRHASGPMRLPRGTLGQILTATASSIEWQDLNLALIYDSPHLTGDPTAPTPPSGDDDDSIATTEWVNDAIILATANSGAKDISATVCADTQRSLPNPSLTSGGLFVVDGQEVLDGQTVMLIGQTNSLQNGLYVYDQPTNTLTRDNAMPAGSIFYSPFYCAIEEGDLYAEVTFEMVESVCTVGTTPNTWADVALGVGALTTGQVVSGPPRATNRTRIAANRRLVAEDLAVYRTTRLSTLRQPQSVYLNLNNFGYVSRAYSAVNMWAQRAQLHQIISEYETIIFDKAIFLEAQVAVPLSNKRFVFMGDGWEGPNRIFITAQNGSFLDIGGSTNFKMEGQCVVETVVPRSASTRAVKATVPFTNFQAESIWTRGFSEALYVNTLPNGLRVDEINVFDFPTERPLLLQGTTANTDKTIIGNLRNIPRFFYTATNTNFTVRPNFDAPVYVHNGTITATRTVTLVTNEYVSRNSEFRLIRTAASLGAFDLDIGPGITALSGPSTWAHLGYDGVAASWVLLGKGSL